jgi:hypothetical protein
MDESRESVLERFWKLPYARHSFEHAKIICEHVMAGSITSTDKAYYSLVLAIHVAYARPFKRSSGGIKKLEENIVPERFKPLHEQMILVRDQVLAHTDPSGSYYRGLPANHVRVKVEIGGSVNLIVQDIKPRVAFIPQIRELCDSLIVQMTKDVEGIGKLQEFIDMIPPIAGEYMVDLKGHRFVAV